MDTSQQSASSEIIPVKAEKKEISLDDFKSMYYLLNAKPDRDIRIFREDRRVSRQDLIELNDQIQEKIKNHQIITNITNNNSCTL